MAASSPSSSSRWLFGPLPDLVLGCGVGWMLAAAIHAGSGGKLEAWVPAGVLILALSFPHYGATLLRVYESAEERSRYALLAVHGSVLLMVGFVLALHSVLLGSLILTLYLTWSPWHYTGQNYGIFLMLARRRGAEVTPLAKRLIYASFLLSFLLTFLALHGIRDANYAPVSAQGTDYRMMLLGIPSAVVDPAMWIVGAAYVATLVAAAVLLLRRGRLRDLAPGAVLVATQALWFSVPVMLRYSGRMEGSSFAPVASHYGFLWVAGAHAAQYLWVTNYYARATTAGSRRHRHGLYLGKAAAAGFAIWTIPAMLFAPRFVWGAAHDAGLAVMIAAVVNLHHFVLDGAIWKLRDGRVARLLLRQAPRADADDRPAVAPAGARRRWLAPALYGAGLLCMIASVGGFYEREYGFRRALEQGDLERAGAALERLSWIGRDGAELHLRLGRALAHDERHDDAIRSLRRSVSMKPSFEGWKMLAELQVRKEAWRAAAWSFDQALAIEPDHPQLLYRSGMAWLEAGAPGQATERLEQAAQEMPERDLVKLSLERARRARNGEPGAAAPQVRAN